jgi:hypothetical protein
LVNRTNEFRRANGGSVAVRKHRKQFRECFPDSVRNPCGSTFTWTPPLESPQMKRRPSVRGNTAKPRKHHMQNLPISKIRSMTVEEQDKLARQAASAEMKLKDATASHKSSFPAIGKVICVIEERLNDLKTLKKIASNTSLASYWESVTKVNGKSIKLNPHALSCAVAFGTYVRSEIISEKDYDDNSGGNLELAASISTAVGGDVSHDAVAQAAEELRHQTKQTRTNLQNILDGVKEPKAMTAEQAENALRKIMAAGHLNVVIASVGAEIAHTEDSEVARSAYFGIQTATDMFSANVIVTKDGAGKEISTRRFPDEVLDGWLNAYVAATTPAPETAPKPDATPAPEAVAA